ncbi:unnamed protein product, partial [Brassica oleracea]
MAPPRKSLEVNIPVPPPINNKPKKEEDGFTTPKGVQSKNPQQTPAAPPRGGKPRLPERGGIRQKDHSRFEHCLLTYISRLGPSASVNFKGSSR